MVIAAVFEAFASMSKRSMSSVSFTLKGRGSEGLLSHEPAEDSDVL